MTNFTELPKRILDDTDIKSIIETLKTLKNEDIKEYMTVIFDNSNTKNTMVSQKIGEIFTTFPKLKDELLEEWGFDEDDINELPREDVEEMYYRIQEQLPIYYKIKGEIPIGVSHRHSGMRDMLIYIVKYKTVDGVDVIAEDEFILRGKKIEFLREIPILPASEVSDAIKKIYEDKNLEHKEIYERRSKIEPYDIPENYPEHVKEMLGHMLNTPPPITYSQDDILGFRIENDDCIVFDKTSIMNGDGSFNKLSHYGTEVYRNDGSWYQSSLISPIDELFGR